MAFAGIVTLLGRLIKEENGIDESSYACRYSHKLFSH